jgi:endonuclease V-like protein UPF0215 family
MCDNLSPKSLRLVKPEIRVLGVDDGRFTPHSHKKVPVIGVVFRGGFWLDGVMSTFVTVDGMDATRNVAEMVLTSPHYRQLRVIILNGVTLAGFNVVDIKDLSRLSGLPVIAVTSKKPDLSQVQKALQHLPESQKRWNAILNAGEIFPVTVKRGKWRIYAESAGITKDLAIEILRLTSTRSKIPEALRVAHLVASGIENC